MKRLHPSGARQKRGRAVRRRGGWRLAGLPLELQLELLAAHHLAVAAHSLATCVFGFFFFFFAQQCVTPPTYSLCIPPLYSFIIIHAGHFGHKSTNSSVALNSGGKIIDLNG